MSEPSNDFYDRRKPKKSKLPLDHPMRRPKWAGASVVCLTCKLWFKVPPAEVRRGKKFCSRACYHKRGSMNPKWRGGIIRSRGRKLVYAPGHPNATFNGTHIMEHRAVMSASLGRPLRPTEIVHHINGDRTDNRLENLQVISSAEHGRLHKPRQITDAAINKARELRSHGWTWTRIAQEVGFSARCVRTYV